MSQLSSEQSKILYDPDGGHTTTRITEYIHVMSLPESRVWIRYRGRVVAGVKANSIPMI